MPKSSWICLVPLVLLACGGAPPPKLSSADVVRSEVVPAGYGSAGTARAACQGTPGWGPLSGQPLASFDCSFQALELELTEQAARAGAEILAGVRCRASASGGRSCSGTMARAAEPGLHPERYAAGEPRVADDDGLPAAKKREITVDLEPGTKAFSRRPRPASEVGEGVALPVSHVELGSLRARCPSNACETRDLRRALRMAAGGLGVSDLVGVSCAMLEGERQCLATLSASELDPETDPRAR